MLRRLAAAPKSLPAPPRAPLRAARDMLTEGSFVYLNDPYPRGFRFPSEAELEALNIPFPPVIFGDAATPRQGHVLEIVMGVLVTALLATAIGLFVYFYRKEHWTFFHAHKQGVTTATRFSAGKDHGKNPALST